MPLEFIEFKGHKYIKPQSEGNAARWVIPMVQYYCKGNGFDIGYSKEEWMLPGAIGIEPSIDCQYDAMKLPNMIVDYIFSSHCLEHIKENIFNVLDYWLSKLKSGGILFLYLPHESQIYWNPENNRKHIHLLNQDRLYNYLSDLGHSVIISNPDLNNSFILICEKI